MRGIDPDCSRSSCVSCPLFVFARPPARSCAWWFVSWSARSPVHQPTGLFVLRSLMRSPDLTTDLSACLFVCLYVCSFCRLPVSWPANLFAPSPVLPPILPLTRLLTYSPIVSLLMQISRQPIHPLVACSHACLFSHPLLRPITHSSCCTLLSRPAPCSLFSWHGRPFIC